MRFPQAQIIGLLAILAALAAAPAAGAETLVPPENSAAFQYTETFPTTGGDKETDKVDNRSGASLDATKAKRLKEQGPAGRAVAAIVATTAPGTTAPATEGGNSGSGDRAEGGKQGESGVNDGAYADSGTGADRGAKGSSGLGEVIEQATGSSASGEMGLLLPLLIVAALAWSIASLWRQRNEA